MKKLTYLLVTILVSSLLVSGLVSAQEFEMKTYTNEKFGFSIRYPKNWEKTQSPKKKNKPQIYQRTSLHLYPSEDLLASVTIYITELAGPASLKEYKRYLELKSKFNGRSGPTEVHFKKFADSRAVISEYDLVSFNKEKVTEKSGSEETKWKKSTWKGKTQGIIRNGYLYRISAGARLEDYEKARKKYLSKILDSFQFTK